MSDPLQLVRDLNIWWYEHAPKELAETGSLPFVYSTTGEGHHFISFCGIPIWDSENEERSYIHEGTPEEDHEPLLPWLLKEVQKVADHIACVTAVVRAMEQAPKM